MNNITLVALVIFTMQFASCKKDVVTPRSTTSIIKEYRNNHLFREFAYTPNRLMQLHLFNYNGVLVDTVQFFYSNNRLDSIYTFNISSGETYPTKYHYNNNQLVGIDKQISHNYSRNYNLSYTNFNELGQIDYVTSSQPFKGVLYFDRYGNLVEHSNEYVASIFNENFETNTFSYNQNRNVLNSFWIIDPLEFTPSENLVVELVQNTRATNDSVGNPNAHWFYKGEKWDVEYTFSPEGNVLTKSILDSHQLVLDSYSYEYFEN